MSGGCQRPSGPRRPAQSRCIAGDGKLNHLHRWLHEVGATQHKLYQRHQKALFPRPGYAEKNGYELDHIIPLALGGHPRNLHNLMLQAWEGPDGAKRNDRLEVKLQCLVCSGDVALTDAQDAIWSNWKAAYSVYGRMVCNRARRLKSGDYGDD